ncbi:MAG: PilZ domain-containing protein [Nitrospirota bacterium]
MAKRRRSVKSAAPARTSSRKTPTQSPRSFLPRARRYWLPSPLLVLEVRGKDYEKVFIGYAENLSLGGLMLSTPKRLKPGDRFPVQFVLPDRTSTVQCTCEVVWRRDSSGAPSTGVGLRFVGIGDEARKVLDQWIRREGKQLAP